MLDSHAGRGGQQEFYTRAEVDALLKSLKSVNPFPVGSIYQSTDPHQPRRTVRRQHGKQIASERVLMGASQHPRGRHHSERPDCRTSQALLSRM